MISSLGSSLSNVVGTMKDSSVQCVRSHPELTLLAVTAIYGATNTVRKDGFQRAFQKFMTGLEVFCDLARLIELIHKFGKTLATLKKDIA